VPENVCGESKGVSFSIAPPGAAMSIAVSAGFGPLSEAQILIDFTKFQDINATIAMGLDLPVIVTAKTLPTASLDFSTSLILVPESNSTVCSCGAAGERPCTLLEKVPSCHSGLAEDFLKHRCVRP
jgi:hypothetical protein